MEQSPDTEIGSSPSLIPKTHSDELQFLDYLSTDFSYLRRFILASQQMVRLLQTEMAQSHEDIQEKLVSNVEIAKETLAEAGASARPFIVCPDHLVRHRQSYYDMLSAGRSLVPYMKDADVKLRLRRLLLPLTSTSHFRIVPPVGRPNSNKDTPSPPCWGDQNPTPKEQSSSPSPAASSKLSTPRRRMRRSAASAVLKFASSPMSYSTCSSNSPSKSLAGRFATSPRRPRTSPYPSVSVPVSRDTDAPPNEQEEADSDTAVSSPPIPDTSTYSPPPQQVQSQPPSVQMPSLPPLAYVSPYSPKPLSLLEQQHRDLGAGYAAFQKSTQSTPSDTPSSERWDWSIPNRPSLTGIDCNLPHPKDPPNSTPTCTDDIRSLPVVVPSCIRRYSEEEYDEANERFKKGLGWGPLVKFDWGGSGSVPTIAEGLTWCTSWDEHRSHPVHRSELVMDSLATFPSEPMPQKSLAESTCIIM